MKQTISGIVPFRNALKEDLVARVENLLIDASDIGTRKLRSYLYRCDAVLSS